MKLASLERISNLIPITNSTFLEVAKLQGMEWPIVVRKGTFKVGDKAVFIPVDTVVQRDTWNEFLFKKDDNSRMIRIKQINLRGTPSMGLLIPLNEVAHLIPKQTPIGLDLSKFLNVTKYEKPQPINGDALGHFPSFLRISDEDNVRSVPELLEAIKNMPIYITKKLDGTSASFYRYNGHFGVCSRRLELKRGDNIYWNIAAKYDLENILPEGLCIQGELCGPKIQNNPLKLPEYKLFVFNVFEIEKQEYWGLPLLLDFCETNNLDMVPILEQTTLNKDLPTAELLQQLQDKADAVKYHDDPGEGIVVRPIYFHRHHASSTGNLSFKIINTLYKD